MGPSLRSAQLFSERHDPELNSRVDKMAKTKPGLLGLRAPVTFVTEGWVAHEHNVPLCQKRGEPYAPTGHYDVWLVGKRRVIDAGLAISNKSVFQNQARPGWRSISWTPRISDGRLLSASEESIKSFRTCEKPQVGRKTDMVEVAENGDGFHETFETAEFL